MELQQEERAKSAIPAAHNQPAEQFERLGLEKWPIWQKEVSEFLRTYDEPATCFILGGEVFVTQDSGEPVRIVEKDLVVFPAGMSCRWKILRDIRKHYRFG